jgi:hypothetical protein
MSQSRVPLLEGGEREDRLFRSYKTREERDDALDKFMAGVNESPSERQERNFKEARQRALEKRRKEREEIEQSKDDALDRELKHKQTQEKIEQYHTSTARALEKSRAPGGGFVSPAQELITATPRLTFVAGRATTSVGDMIRGSSTYGITQTKPIYMPEAFKVEKMEGGGGKSMPPPASEYDWKAARRAEIIAAQAAQDKQTQERRLNQAARDAETEAIEAEKRARRVNTAPARAKAAQALEKAKKAQEAAKRG